MPNDVFISYDRHDLDFVTEVHEYLLTQQGISAWFDQSDIETGDQWLESIVNGILECKVFVLVLSPDSVASKNVRRQIDLAEHHRKQILPLMWRETEFPPSIMYQLAGIQYLDFKETASEENLSNLAGVLTKLLDGKNVSEATVGEPAIMAEGISAQPLAESTQIGRRGRGRLGGRLSSGYKVSAIVTGAGVMTQVVTRITDFTAEEQDAINEELKWLFNAAEHFLKIRRGEIDNSTPVPLPIPPEAETSTGVNNVILGGLDDFSIAMIASEIERIIKRINVYKGNLDFYLDKQAQLGGSAVPNIALSNSIIAQQRSISEQTQRLALLMEQVYGVLVYGPEDLVNQFA